MLYPRYRNAISRAVCEHDIDLIHFHGIDFHEYLPKVDLPILATLHLPPDWYPVRVFQESRANLFLNCVSAAQHRRCPGSSLLLDPIANGVRIPESLPHAKRNFAVSLGRICPEKGFHLAMDAAKHAGIPLLLAGQIFPYKAHVDYFEHEIKPRQDSRTRFIGPIGRKRKNRLLAAARCLLVPSLVSETSSLVAMEALACGTPVIAFPHGALPEIAEHGKTGFIVHSLQEMADAIHDAGTLSPNDCRTAALKRYSVERRSREYIRRYAALISRCAHDFSPQKPELLCT